MKQKDLELVTGHAYAVLDLQEIQGVKLMQIKNPWNSRSWNGPYAYQDRRMTQSLRSKLKYDIKQAESGVFWIDYDSFIQYFEGLYVNWNPNVLKNKISLHRAWRTSGPADDSIVLAHNPQFRLLVNVRDSYAVVWIVLSRHVIHKSQILSPNKKDFLTIHVFDRRQGKLVLDSGKAMISGVYSNNPHVLCRLTVPSGSNAYTVAVSSYEKDNRTGLNYSLQVYSTENCTPKPTLHQIPNKLRNSQVVKSQWKGVTAGGRLGSEGYKSNPMFSVSLATRGVVRVRLMSHKEMCCQVSLYSGESKAQVGNTTYIANSGKYRYGFCYLEIDDLNAGNYVIVPSGYERGAPGAIILEIESSENFKVNAL